MKSNVYDLEAYRKKKADASNEVRRLIAEKLEYQRRSMVYNQIRDHEESMDYI